LSAGKAALIFALDESRSLASAIAAQAGLAVAPLEERAFEAGEFKLRPLVPVRERTVFVVQSLAGTAGASVSYRLLRLLFLLFVLRDAGAARMVAVVPYLAFARKERRTQPRDPVSSRYVAELLETTGLDRLVALDVHNPAAFDNAYRIPTDHLSAIPYFADHFARQHVGGSLTVASPDIGGIKRAQIFSERLAGRVSRDVDFAFVEKRRARGVVSTGRSSATCRVMRSFCSTIFVLRVQHSVEPPRRCAPLGRNAFTRLSRTHRTRPVLPRWKSRDSLPASC
jgi:ribose-phosphate pyrophosphokinase